MAENFLHTCKFINSYFLVKNFLDVGKKKKKFYLRVNVVCTKGQWEAFF